MTIDERIKYAEDKRDEAMDSEEWDNARYWVGYIDGLYAAKRSLEG